MKGRNYNSQNYINMEISSIGFCKLSDSISKVVYCRLHVCFVLTGLKWSLSKPYWVKEAFYKMAPSNRSLSWFYCTKILIERSDKYCILEKPSEIISVWVCCIMVDNCPLRKSFQFYLFLYTEQEHFIWSWRLPSIKFLFFQLL